MVGKGPCSHDMSGLVWIPAKARHCLTQLVIITPYGNHSEWSYYPIWGYLPSTRNRDFRPLGRYPESGFPITRKTPAFQLITMLSVPYTGIFLVVGIGNFRPLGRYPIFGYLPSGRNREFPTTRKIPGYGVSS